MNITIQNPQKAECFASIFQHIKVFTEQINIFFEKDKMYIQSMDHSHVSIFEINIPATWFDIYTHNAESTIKIGISAPILHRILNAREKTQQLNLVFNIDDEDRLFVHFTGINKSEFDKHFELPLMDIDNEIMSIPDMEYDVEFTLLSSNFANIVNQLKMFGDDLQIECSEEKIMLTSKSQEHGKMFVEIKIDDLTSFAINEGETIHINFSLNYLHNICLYNKLAKEIDIKICKNAPLKIIYNLHEDATLTFFLAPRMNDNE
jgi:proliferating cell nuclear antigen PCNA